jgi:hypothetical protein
MSFKVLAAEHLSFRYGQAEQPAIQGRGYIAAQVISPVPIVDKSLIDSDLNLLYTKRQSNLSLVYSSGGSGVITCH